MDRDLTSDYLRKAGMEPSQAEALARIFDDMEQRVATKSDLANMGADLRADMAAMKAELTWRMIAVVGFFATAVSLFTMVVG